MRHFSPVERFYEGWARALQPPAEDVERHLAFGRHVLPELVAGIERHRETRGLTPATAERIPPTQVALGAVLKFTDLEIAQALPLTSVIVVDKRSRRDSAVKWLVNNRDPVHTFVLGEPDLGRRTDDGAAPLLSHAGGMWAVSEEAGLIEPVRVQGWWGKDKQPKPHVHSKVLVLGWHGLWLRDTPYGEYEDPGLIATHVWLGSANWTRNARTSAEWGLWTSDRSIVHEFHRWVLHLIASSEPISSEMDDPTPDLSYADWPEPDEDCYFDELEEDDG